jgi:hypothetical protein
MKCAECECTPLDCKGGCSVCTKKVCCCVVVKKNLVYEFLKNIRYLYATALAIEILCICAADTGALDITLGYILGYSLAAFTTFAIILGRSTFSDQICSCCSVLEQDPRVSLQLF